MSSPVEGLKNTDVVETWEVTEADHAAHFGLLWNGAGYHLLLLRQRRNGAHATLIADDATGVADVRLGWPTDWPEHDQSNCTGHGSN